MWPAPGVSAWTATQMGRIHLSGAEGPHYVFDNVVVGYDGHGWNPWTLPYWNEPDWPQEWLKTGKRLGGTAFDANTPDRLLGREAPPRVQPDDR